jgi:hypothetical protein
LILFSNLDSLTLDEEKVSFVCKLKLTGTNVNQSIIFPDNIDKLDSFISNNHFKQNQKIIIKKLADEAKNNKNLKIEISGNS